MTNVFRPIPSLDNHNLRKIEISKNKNERKEKKCDKIWTLCSNSLLDEMIDQWTLLFRDNHK